MDETHMGFEVEGSWEEIVVFGEKICASSVEAISQMNIPAEKQKELLDYVNEFDDWRPKIHEVTSEVSEKTAEKTSTNSPEGEEIQENVQSAGENIKESFEAVEQNNPKKAGSHWKESTESLVLAGGGQLKRVLQWVEESIYKNVMTLLSPYYFDNNLFSASIWKKQNGNYVFEITPNDDDFRSHFEKELESLNDLDRWHIESEDEPNLSNHEESEDFESVTNKRSMEQVEEQAEENMNAKRENRGTDNLD